ncbi:MAG: hypothetical protein Q4B91_03340 [Atopobiaceae bacterium]|nr:hypothetical protein [Atopobiaceae bacterium]
MSEGTCWTYVDSVLRSTRNHLESNDLCYYYLIRDSRGWDDGPHAKANQLITNFKHDPQKYAANSAPMYYKHQAIETLAGYVKSFFGDQEDVLESKDVYLVPIPTSKPRSSQDYDPRLDSLCRIVERDVPWVKYLPLLDTKQNVGKAHAGTGSRDPGFLARNMTCGEIPPSSSERYVVLVDDVLTTGAHYAACKRVVQGKFSKVVVLGLFLSVHVNEERHDPLDWAG